ncbi:hypothetical protein HDU98_004567 [Podochytrium sp. JEL0797]|nr:hypothetical protein HDU98_004567 [Podochytrium sp. JEL0797]
MFSITLSTLTVFATLASAQTAIGSACAQEGAMACALSAKIAGAGAIVICSGGTNVLVDDCDRTPSNACTLIGGIPFCVDGKGILGAAGGAAAQAPAAANAPAAAKAKAAPVKAQAAAGAAPADGKAQIGAACTPGQYACGPHDAAANQDTIVICQGGAFVKLDNCDENTFTCKLIGIVPFCV